MTRPGFDFKGRPLPIRDDRNQLGTSTIIRGDARALPLADNTVDLIVTSPPYFALRSYQDDGEHYPGQIGSEPTPADFLDALLDATRECVRVLKPSGSLWVNLGDKYASTPPGNTRSLANSAEHQARQKAEYDKAWRVPQGYRQKSLMGMPWRYAIRCIDDLALILRAEIIWAKPNGLPESVTDRVRRSHEQWFHFTLMPRYYSAVEEIREAQNEAWRSTGRVERMGNHRRASENNGFGLEGDQPREYNPLGKLPGSVWTIPTEPLTVPDHLGIDHFAAFPSEWPKRIIRGWSPAGVCVECGEGRRPVVIRPSGSWHDHDYDGQGHNQNGRERKRRYLERIANGQVTQVTGYACACPAPTAPTTPGIILDPFGGTGTTALAAKALGRHGITIDYSHDYSRLAEWRTNDRNQLAKVLHIDRQEQQPDTQPSLLDMLPTYPGGVPDGTHPHDQT